MRIFQLLALVSILGGCADAYLTDEEKKAFAEGAGVLGPVLPSEPNKPEPTLKDAANEANKLSAAYYKAGTRSQNAQDFASGVVIVTAASVVGGAVTGTSDAALANRGIAAVGVQQAASRGVGKTSIQSIYDGAQTLNCIGGMAAIYSIDTDMNADPVAVEVTLSVIREVRIAVRRGLTREVAKYSDMLEAFRSALPDKSGGANENAVLLRASKVSKGAILEYLARLGGCVEQKSLSKTPGSGDDGDGQ